MTKHNIKQITNCPSRSAAIGYLIVVLNIVDFGLRFLFIVTLSAPSARRRGRALKRGVEALLEGRVAPIGGRAACCSQKKCKASSWLWDRRASVSTLTYIESYTGLCPLTGGGEFFISINEFFFSIYVIDILGRFCVVPSSFLYRVTMDTTR